MVTYSLLLKLSYILNFNYCIFNFYEFKLVLKSAGIFLIGSYLFRFNVFCFKHFKLGSFIFYISLFYLKLFLI